MLQVRHFFLQNEGLTRQSGRQEVRHLFLQNEGLTRQLGSEEDNTHERQQELLSLKLTLLQAKGELQESCFLVTVFNMGRIENIEDWSSVVQT